MKISKFYQLNKINQKRIKTQVSCIKIYVQLGYFYFLQAVNPSMKGLHIIAHGFNPRYDTM